MQIAAMLQENSIALQQSVQSYDDAIHTLVGLMANSGNLLDANAYEIHVLERERQGSTCVGDGIGIPHAKSSAVGTTGLAAMTLAEPGLDCGAPGGPIRLLFLIAAPTATDNGAMLHIQVLAQLAGLLMDKAFSEKLRAAATPAEFLALIAAQECADAAAAEPDAATGAETVPPPPAPLPRGPETETGPGRQDPAAQSPNPPEVPAGEGEGAATATPPLQQQPAAEKTYRLLAVTSCPSGLAHTYLAAAALKSSAKKRGVSIKVETNGAAGVRDELSAAEIAAADCIIVGADKSVEMERFLGKPVLQVGVGAAVRNPEALIDKALDGRVPAYTGSKKGYTLRQRLQDFGPDFYRHLMSGVSHMLPFVTGGGLLVALSMLLRQLGAPANVYNIFYNVGTTALQLMYIALSGYIASSIGGLPALMPGALGGYLAETGMSIAAKNQWVSSGFGGALAAGLLAGMTARGITKLCRRMPRDLDHIKNTLIYPAGGLLVVGVAMLVFVNPPMGHFNAWLNTVFVSLRGGSRVMICAVLAALMASDYGGPINKAAYLSGTVALVSGQYDIMAAVMLGGMVPPIGVAVACWLFPAKFTRQEYKSIPQTLLLGASFVTEGALPFALKDPLRVIPAAMLGSGLAGMLGLLFGCACPAPHGGLFLLPVLTNPLGFVAALAGGSVIMALLLGFTKKDLPTENGKKPNR